MTRLLLSDLLSHSLSRTKRARAGGLAEGSSSKKEQLPRLPSVPFRASVKMHIVEVISYKLPFFFDWLHAEPTAFRALDGSRFR